MSTSLTSDAPPSKRTAPSTDGAGSLAAPRALLALMAASLWAAPHWLWPAEGEAVAGLAYVALVGCGSFSLTCVGLAWGSSGLVRHGAPAHVAARHVAARRSLAVGLGLALLPCAALAYWVHVATHHRPLGAATFALGAAGFGLLGVLVARRPFRGDLGSTRGGIGARVAPSVALLAAALLFVVLARGVYEDAESRRALADGVLGVLMASLVVNLRLPVSVTRLRRWALPICVAVWVTTVWLLGSDLELRARVKSAPVIAGVAGLALQ